MRKLTAASLAIAAFGLGMILAAGLMTARTADYLPPCPTEDSTGCWWDAATMGDGTGNDVVTVEVEK